MAWTPQSWRSKPIQQGVEWGNAPEVERVLAKLNTLPPLVSAFDVDRLRAELADVARGNGFLLQGGDCSELFEEVEPSKIEGKIGLLLSMSLILIWGRKQKVVRIMRMAGQFAKPRSSPTEKVRIAGKDVEVMSYRGDIVNGAGVEERTPQPQRMLEAYFHASAAIGHTKNLLASGFASLKRKGMPAWAPPLKHVRSPELLKAYEDIVNRLSEAIDFMGIVGAESPTGLDDAAIYMSHESLMLEYEEALTRNVSTPSTPAWMDLSAHFVWVGDRTRRLDSAHIEYVRGIRNPIGVKVGPTMTCDELKELLRILDPHNEPGRLSLICRYGASKVATHLPDHIRTVQASGSPAIFVCDPMHGNIVTVGAPGESRKTRHFDDIMLEVITSLEIHESLGSRLGGLHLEVTGEVDAQGFSVTECLGGSQQLEAGDLELRYTTTCDPRLNYEQGLDAAFATVLRQLPKSVKRPPPSR